MDATDGSPQYQVTLSENINLVVVENTYGIDPKSVSDLPAALNRNTTNGQYHAYAYWNVSWRYQYDTSGAQCKLASSTVTLKTELLMPELMNNWPVDEDTRDIFQLYQHNLLTHEYGHLDFGRTAANDIHKWLNSGQQANSCSELSNKLNQRAKLIIDEQGQLDDTYDENTQHGRTQGAYIYDLLP